MESWDCDLCGEGTVRFREVIAVPSEGNSAGVEALEGQEPEREPGYDSVNDGAKVSRSASYIGVPVSEFTKEFGEFEENSGFACLPNGQRFRIQDIVICGQTKTCIMMPKKEIEIGTSPPSAGPLVPQVATTSTSAI